MRTLPFLAAALVACAPVEESPVDAGFTPVGTYTVSGSIAGIVPASEIAVVATETRTDTFTFHTLEVTLADLTGGALRLVLTDNEAAMRTGDYLRANSTRLLSEATWTSSGATWVGNPLADEDASTVTLEAVAWEPGGRVRGTFALALQNADDPARTVTLDGSFHAEITSGP